MSELQKSGILFSARVQSHWGKLGSRVEDGMNPVVSAMNNLKVSLTVFQVFSGLYGAVGLIYIFGGAVLGFVPLPLTSSDGEAVNVTSRALLTFLAVLVGLLIVGSGVAYIFVFGWIKDWQARVVGWTQGQVMDKMRLEKLSSTLSKWILWSQWSPLIGAVLTLLLLTIGGAIVGGLIGSLGGLGGSSLEGTLSSVGGAGALGGLIAVFVVIWASPFIILNWLIFKAIQVWMLEVSNRAVGRPTNVNLMNQSNAVSSWFVFCQVVIGLGALLFVFSGLTAGSADGSSGNPIVAILIPLALNVLYFMMLQWSKTFMFGVAGYAERYGSSHESLSKV
jgi:hypothetical protein